MHPLLRKALLRLLLFYLYGLFVAWIFTLIERKDESHHNRMERTLNELRKEMDLKYNITDNDFESFVRRAGMATMEDEELDWTFLNSCGFVFAALTTIGFGNITPKTQIGQGVTIIFCLLGIPITMLAMKTAGQLLANCISFLVVKTETELLKRAAPRHVKLKSFFVVDALVILLLVLGSVATTYVENWSFLEGLYAWFTTFTTIGFGDYIHLESLARKADHGEMSKVRLIGYGLLFTVPYVIGLGLVSCILTCLVDSLDQIRDFRDRYIKCCPSFLSLMRRFLFRERSSFDVKAEENYVYDTNQEMNQKKYVSCEDPKLEL